VRSSFSGCIASASIYRGKARQVNPDRVMDAIIKSGQKNAN
jgi:hypothetical protein